jgi:hypothetical protein
MPKFTLTHFQRIVLVAVLGLAGVLAIGAPLSNVSAMVEGGDATASSITQPAHGFDDPEDADGLDCIFPLKC